MKMDHIFIEKFNYKQTFKNQSESHLIKSGLLICDLGTGAPHMGNFIRFIRLSQVFDFIESVFQIY